MKRCLGCVLLAGLLACGDDGSEWERMKRERSVSDLGVWSGPERAREEAVVQRRRAELARAMLADEADEAKRRSGIKVDLPSGTAQDIDVTAMSLVIDVAANGAVGIGGAVQSDAALEQVLRAAYRHDATTQIVIRAAEGVAHGRVVEIMETAKRVGLTRLAIATTPTPP